MTDPTPSLATPYRTHTCGQLRAADAGTERAPLRLGPSPARPRPADLPRPARPPRDHPGRHRRRPMRRDAHEVASRVRPEFVVTRRRRGRAAAAGHREREAADRRDRAPGDRASTILSEAKTPPFYINDPDAPIDESAAPQVPLPRHPARADAAPPPAPQPDGPGDPRGPSRATASSRSRRRPSSRARPRAPATSSSRAASSRAASTPCRRARSSSSSC